MPRVWKDFWPLILKRLSGLWTGRKRGRAEKSPTPILLSPARNNPPSSRGEGTSRLWVTPPITLGSTLDRSQGFCDRPGASAADHPTGSAEPSSRSADESALCDGDPLARDICTIS